MELAPWIVSHGAAEMLRLLLANGNDEMYTRELARHGFLALRTAQVEVAKLEAANLIVSRSNGYQRSYRANPKHPLVRRCRSSCAKAPRTRNLLRDPYRAEEGKVAHAAEGRRDCDQVP